MWRGGGVRETTQRDLFIRLKKKISSLKGLARQSKYVNKSK